jgi:hypothetical protein
MPHPLALPVTRAHKARTTWAWTLGYTAFLLLLSAVPVALFAAYKSVVSPPNWVPALAISALVLLILLATVLCGALLGKWRALPVMLLALGLPVFCAYLIDPGAFTPSNSAQSGNLWLTYASAAALPFSTFITGWIYERRRYANFGLSFLSMILGVALLIILPIILASILNSAGALTESSIAGYLVVSWCLAILVIFPLALIVVGCEAALHWMVRGKKGSAKKEES